jgi:hypothetical protein
VRSGGASQHITSMWHDHLLTPQFAKHIVHHEAATGFAVCSTITEAKLDISHGV